jgi:hypothetical protein
LLCVNDEDLPFYFSVILRHRFDRFDILLFGTNTHKKSSTTQTILQLESCGP